jgi:hypothetical protein
MSLSTRTTIIPAQPGWVIFDSNSGSPIIAWAIDPVTHLAFPVTCEGIIEDDYPIYFDGDKQN